jgi:hypothetical protein
MTKLIVSVFALTAISATAFAEPVKMADQQLNTVAGGGFGFVNVQKNVLVADIDTSSRAVSVGGNCAIIAACGGQRAASGNIVNVEVVQVNR